MVTFLDIIVLILLFLLIIVGTGLIITIYFIFLRLENNEKHSIRALKKESFMIATKQCKYFFSVILKFNDKLEESIEKEKIKFFDKSKVEVYGDHIDVEISKSDTPKKLKKILPELNTLLNTIESFSMFFTNRVADERIAFRIVGTKYCDIVKRFLPFIHPLYEEDPENNYTSTVNLFLLWHKRIEIADIPK